MKKVFDSITALFIAILFFLTCFITAVIFKVMITIKFAVEDCNPNDLFEEAMMAGQKGGVEMIKRKFGNLSEKDEKWLSGLLRFHYKVVEKIFYWPF